MSPDRFDFDFIEPKPWRRGEFQAAMAGFEAPEWPPYVSPRILEAASWALGTQILERNEEDLYLTLSGPREGADYDGLCLHRGSDDTKVHINRVSSGSALRTGRIDGEPDFWNAMVSEWLFTDDRIGMVQGVTRWMGLSPCDFVPLIGNQTFMLRVLARFLAAHAFDRERWRIDGLRLTTSAGWYFDPVLAERAGLELEPVQIVRTDDLRTNRLASTFILLRDEIPVGIVTTDGGVTRCADRATLDLLMPYRAQGYMLDLVFEIDPVDEVATDLALFITHEAADEGEESTEAVAVLREPFAGSPAHHWVLPGTAKLSSDDYARVLASESGDVVDGVIPFAPTQMFCARCSATFGEESDPCSPDEEEPFGHAWALHMSMPLAGEEVRTWEEEARLPDLIPRSTTAYCQLCGELSNDAPSQCAEKVFLFGSD